MKRKIIIKKKRRNLKVADFAESNQAAQGKEERYYINLVRNNERYDIIISLLRENVTPTAIASHFAMYDYITVSERVFAKALKVFKAKCRKLILMDVVESKKSLDELISADRPDTDVVRELNRLYLLQKERITIDFRHEKQMDKLFNTTNKEIEVASEILEKIAKVTGLMIDSKGKNTADDAALATEVREKLRGLELDEGERNKLYNLTTNFIKKMSHDEKVETN
jgi:hypothetical protein